MVLRLLALPIVFALLSGCHTNPQIRVTALDHVSTGPNADEYVLRIDLRNTTDSPMVLDRWEYRIATNAGSWSTEWIASRTLPARSITFDTLPVVIRHAPHDGDSQSVVTWRVDGNLHYLLPGQLAETLFDLGLSRPDVGFSASGETTPIGLEAPAVNRQ